MPFYVLRFAIVASNKLILCGPSCVDCKYNFALDSKCVDFRQNVLIFFVLRDTGTTQLPVQTHFCLTLILTREEEGKLIPRHPVIVRNEVYSVKRFNKKSVQSKVADFKGSAGSVRVGATEPIEASFRRGCDRQL